LSADSDKGVHNMKYNFKIIIIIIIIIYLSFQRSIRVDIELVNRLQ